METAFRRGYDGAKLHPDRPARHPFIGRFDRTFAGFDRQTVGGYERPR
jgi:hypothetical protein